MYPFLLTFFVILIIITCILIVASILLQEDKSGGGIGMIGGSSQSFFGASSSSILSKVTSILLTFFLVLSVVIAILAASFSRQSVITESDIELTEMTEYELADSTKKISEPPAKVLIEDFDRDAVEKILNSTDKKFVLDLYDKSGKYYALKSKIKDKEKDKLVQILNAVGFSLETGAVKVNP